jgi:hypothetical protein
VSWNGALLLIFTLLMQQFYRDCFGEASGGVESEAGQRRKQEMSCEGAKGSRLFGRLPMD